MRVNVAAEGIPESLPEEHKTCIYRIVQEALHNCARHSGANQVRITLKNSAGGIAKIAAGKTGVLKVGYKSQGLSDWRYSFGSANRSTSGNGEPNANEADDSARTTSNVAQVRDFSMKMTTNFKDIDFPDNTLSPTLKTETASGWNLEWTYKNLVSGYQIAMTMPEKLQPGPLAGRISFFAPVSLFFFFFLMLIITTSRGIELHPMNYFFLAAAFFSFHLLLAISLASTGLF